jgi:pilus assembly protein CpaF
MDSRAFDWGILAPLMSDPDITEIMVNAHDRIFTDQASPDGHGLKRTKLSFGSADELNSFVQQLSETADRPLTDYNPVVDFTLSDGTRVSLICPPVSATPSLTIRRSRLASFSLEKLVAMDVLPAGIAHIIYRMTARAGDNAVIYGETGSGKTTLLTALARWKKHDLRLVSLEDVREISLPDHENVVPLQVNPTNSMVQLMGTTMRMHAQGVLVGELRDATAYAWLLESAIIRHSLTTLHANSASAALRRLVSLARQGDQPLSEAAVRQIVVDSLGLLIGMARDSAGRRFVRSVDEVMGLDTKGEFEVANLYRFDLPEDQTQGYDAREIGAGQSA